jgi:hypothetical protein
MEAASVNERLYNRIFHSFLSLDSSPGFFHGG